MVLADWSVANGRPDFLDVYRGTYADEEACQAIILRHGDLASLIAARCADAGLPVASVRTRGAIGVIGSAGNPLRQWGAIFDGARWQVRTVEGFQPIAARVLGMWSV